MALGNSFVYLDCTIGMHPKFVRGLHDRRGLRCLYMASEVGGTHTKCREKLFAAIKPFIILRLLFCLHCSHHCTMVRRRVVILCLQDELCQDFSVDIAWILDRFAIMVLATGRIGSSANQTGIWILPLKVIGRFCLSGSLLS